ncbi:unnamed protein product [Didymodactylos carnosus]|uniref:Uncharacterized protein n=1 Tax=Didymodactylos carnosus TaxID=1234261 RepID=A0A8S2HQD1_9BILA|nr:unnamed protein product [Didymodactylos carnosus]CAF3668015.1 unnamed protein product [Didymodactylos carnosus]
MDLPLYRPQLSTGPTQSQQRRQEKQRKDSTYKLSYAEALQLADKTAKQYQISLGSNTLPHLLLRNLTSIIQNPTNRGQIDHLTVNHH